MRSVLATAGGMGRPLLAATAPAPVAATRCSSPKVTASARRPASVSSEMAPILLQSRLYPASKKPGSRVLARQYIGQGAGRMAHGSRLRA